MATVTGFTAARMLEIENSTVVDGEVTGDNLILVTRGGTQIDAGSVRGATGPKGDVGQAGIGVSVGQLANFPKLPVPAGWLPCDGVIYNIADYPALGAYLANTFGGDGVNTFGVPDYRGRGAVHYDPSQTEFNALGKVGGKKTHALAVSELPVHNHPHTLVPVDHQHYHSLSMANHAHTISHVHNNPAGGWLFNNYAQQLKLEAGAGGQTTPNTGPPDQAWSGGFNTAAINGSIGSANQLALSGAIGNTGSGAAHTIMSPYVVVVTAIRT